MSLAERGRFAEAARYEAGAIGIAEPTQHVFAISMALFAASVLHLLKGDHAHALARIELWLAVARTGNFLFHLPWGIASSAWPLAQLGETSEALNRIREGEQLLERLAAGGLLANLAWAFFTRGGPLLLSARAVDARVLARSARESGSS